MVDVVSICRQGLMIVNELSDGDGNEFKGGGQSFHLNFRKGSFNKRN